MDAVAARLIWLDAVLPFGTERAGLAAMVAMRRRHNLLHLFDLASLEVRRLSTTVVSVAEENGASRRAHCARDIGLRLF
jgi:hypothetical protein